MKIRLPSPLPLPMPPLADHHVPSRRRCRLLAGHPMVALLAHAALASPPARLHADRQVLQLTKEGEAIVADGSPEAIVFAHVPADGGILSDNLDKLVGPTAKVGLSKAIQSKWLQVVKEPLAQAEAAAAAAAEAVGAKKKDAAKKRVLRVASEISDVVQIQLKAVKTGNPPSDPDLTVLKKRGLVSLATIKSFKVAAGSQVSARRMHRGILRGVAGRLCIT